MSFTRRVVASPVTHRVCCGNSAHEPTPDRVCFFRIRNERVTTSGFYRDPQKYVPEEYPARRHKRGNLFEEIPLHCQGVHSRFIFNPK